MSLLRKKSVAQIQQETGECELKRSLSVWNLISLGIGCIIGAGIFSLTGEQTAVYAGPAIMISFVLAAVACAFAALCYAELSSTLPVSGSAYTYAYTTLGELPAWVMGWLLILEYGIAASTVAVSWGGYFVSLMKDFGVMVPAALSSPTILYDPQVGGAAALGLQHAFNLPAFCSVMLLTWLLIVGVKESASINNAIVALKIFLLVLFIVIGLPHIDTSLWHPFIPDPVEVKDASGATTVVHYGWSGILHAAAVISFAFVGFEAVSTAAQESKNPQRDMPVGILASLAICTVLYILVGAVLTGLVPYKDLNVPDPLAVAVDVLHVGWLKWVVKIGAVIGMFSVTLVLLYGQTRIFYSMARDGLLPKVFSRIHPKHKTPHINTAIVGLVTGLVAGFTPIDILGDLVSLGTLLAFAIVCFSVLYLRETWPDMPRVFSVPFYPVTPILGIISCGWLMSGIFGMMKLLFIYYIPVGLLIYCFYGYKQSHLKSEEPFNNPFSRANLKSLGRGEFSLSMSFWGYGVGGGFGLFYLFEIYSAILPHFSDLVAVFTFIILLLMGVSYIAVSCVGIWRAAGNFKGHTVWKFLARFTVLMEMAIVAVLLYALIKAFFIVKALALPPSMVS